MSMVVTLKFTKDIDNDTVTTQMDMADALQDTL